MGQKGKVKSGPKIIVAMIPGICQPIDVRHGIEPAARCKLNVNQSDGRWQGEILGRNLARSSKRRPSLNNGQHKAEPCSLWTSRNGGPLGEGMAASVAHPACHNKGRTVSRTATSSQRNQASLGEGEPLDVGCQMRYTAGSIPRADRNVIMHSQYKGALSLNQLTTRQLVTITKG